MGRGDKIFYGRFKPVKPPSWLEQPGLNWEKDRRDRQQSSADRKPEGQFKGAGGKGLSADRASRCWRRPGDRLLPEGFIPAHPIWYHHHSATGAISNRLFSPPVQKNGGKHRAPTPARPGGGPA